MPENQEILEELRNIRGLLEELVEYERERLRRESDVLRK
jgi:hypothetical protein